MTYYVDFTNTGYIEDGVLKIEPDKGDGTEIRFEIRDENGKSVESAVLDVENLFCGKSAITRKLNMTYAEWCSLNDYEEIDRQSADNHIFHYIQTGDRQIEIDEDLQTMQITISDVNYEEE